MKKVKPKKALGQHFLNDRNIALRIAAALSGTGYSKVLEIGPGMGILTGFLLENKHFETWVVEIDSDSVDYLRKFFPELKERIISGDFLRLDLEELGEFGLIGNFPYNISSQILFRMLELKDRIPQMAGMFQKEVAERICAKPHSKSYGILSVLLQAHYDCEYLFTVSEQVFTPPPKVKSGVIRLTRKEHASLDCDPVLFKDLVKTAFNQRRKTLRNSLHKFQLPDDLAGWEVFIKLRPEQLEVKEFIALAQLIEKYRESEQRK